MVKWQLMVSEEAWGLQPFAALLKRDKSKGKAVANAEVLFVWYYCDIKSNYLHMKEEDRTKEIINDIPSLPDGWERDELIDEAIRFYKKFDSVLVYLYKQALSSAYAVGDYLSNTAALLNERDLRGTPVTKIADITRGLKDIKIIIKELKGTEKEVIKEEEDNANKTKGSRTFNLFEDGL